MNRILIIFLSLFLSPLSFSQKMPEKADVLNTMKRATQYMVDKVSYRGGYVWSYLPDLSRQWGEMEAYRSMIWIQPPGTPSVGHVFMDAYHATNDAYYLNAAMQTAKALIKAQHPSGGWHYMHDFGGDKSIRFWYETIGANGWRLEEFQHYYGNATFDDGGTFESATLLLRLYTENNDPIIKEALDKAINFFLNSQYPNGGWPQRFPLIEDGKRDYTSDITFNDDVAVKNILFLIMCYNEFGELRLLDAIERGMNNYLELQLPKPQPGWAMQYDGKGRPASARSYEPKCIATGTTESNLYQLMYFYTLTGDKKFMERIPETIDWLDELRLPDSLIRDNRTHPSFIELKTNKPLYIHRKGSNVTNGEYFADHNPEQTVIHYRSTRTIDVVALRKSYNKLISQNPEFFIKNSPLKKKSVLPGYFTKRDGKMSDMNSRDLPPVKLTGENVHKVIVGLNSEGYWPTSLTALTNPYIGKAPYKVAKGDYSLARVGDKYDTSPFINKDSDIVGISTGVYIKNMALLIEYLVSTK